jgi:hypothetical protein
MKKIDIDHTLRGRIVFIERFDENGKVNAYDSGLVLVECVTPNTITMLRIADDGGAYAFGGYTGGSQSIKGLDAYQVPDEKSAFASLRKLIKAASKEIEDVAAKRIPTSWVQHVYTKAAARIERIEALLGESAAAPAPDPRADPLILKPTPGLINSSGRDVIYKWNAESKTHDRYILPEGAAIAITTTRTNVVTSNYSLVPNG